MVTLVRVSLIVTGPGVSSWLCVVQQMYTEETTPINALSFPRVFSNNNKHKEGEEQTNGHTLMVQKTLRNTVS